MDKRWVEVFAEAMRQATKEDIEGVMSSLEDIGYDASDAAIIGCFLTGSSDAAKDHYAKTHKAEDSN